MTRRLPGAVVSVICVALTLLSGHGHAAPPDYRIGADDVLGISVWDNKDLDQVVFVRPDGKISLPLVGEIDAAGRTVAELAGALAEMYGRTIKSAQVTVNVREIRSRAVFFVGGVSKAGPLQLTQDLTLLQALSMAGGVAAGGDPESAFVLRGETAIPVDLSSLMQKGSLRYNLKLQPGDTIVVPVADVVYVQGEVKTPGLIKFTKDLTMVKAITQAGGFTPLAAPKRASLLRGDGTKKEIIRVNVQEMFTDAEAAGDTALKPNDIIIIPQRLF